MLTKDEKKYLWSKIELLKKKKATATENDLYQMLMTDADINEDGFIKILNSLEYSFKKRLKEGPEIKNDIFMSIKGKLPDSWLGVKYSNLKQKEERMNKKPSKTSSKEDVIKYLTSKNIKFDESKPKTTLLKLLENNKILNWEQFIIK
jgi:hypothetical protein